MPAPPTFEHVAAFVDDSGAARRALAHGIALRELSGGRLSVVHVLPGPAFLVSLAASLGGSPVPDPEISREAAEIWLGGLTDGLEATEAVLLTGHPAEEACEWARDNGCDAMVIASHRGVVEQVRMGSFAAHVTRHAPCPVLLVPPGDGER